MMEDIKMAQASFSVQMDDALKRQFDALCDDFGMTASTAINVFAKTVVRERRIPFEISAPHRIPREEAMRAFLSLRESAKQNGLQDMTLDEISEEIRLAREGKE